MNDGKLVLRDPQVDQVSPGRSQPQQRRLVRDESPGDETPVVPSGAAAEGKVPQVQLDVAARKAGATLDALTIALMDDDGTIKNKNYRRAEELRWQRQWT